MIIDCFTFFNELDLLEYRLEYLYDTVDYFVIVEANITHSGTPKPMRYLENISRYHKYSDKILYMPLAIDPSLYNLDYKPTTFEPGAPQWSVENLQRNHIAKALELFPDDAMVGISDLDEIPSKSAIEMAQGILGTEIEACCLEQEMFYYNFRQMTVTGWIPGALATNRFAKRVTPQVVRNQAMWNMLQHIPNGGWHLSCWGSPDEIAYKIENFAHQELNVPEFTNVSSIQQRISDGRDPFDRGAMLHVDPMNLPKLPHEVVRIFGKDDRHSVPR
jgi:beta-1,4-mannosyl-glycoprotein beta-1,4-N-acetylglucosaminyltransferase